MNGKSGEGRGETPASGEQKRGEVGRETSTHTHTGRQMDGWTEGDRERKREGWAVGRALKREHSQCAQVVLFLATAEDIYFQVRPGQVKLTRALF